MGLGYRTVQRSGCVQGLAAMLGVILAGQVSAMPIAGSLWVGISDGAMAQPEKPASPAAKPAPAPAPTTAPTQPATPPAGQPTPPKPPAPQDKPPADPAVDDIIKDIQKPAPPPKTVTPSAKPGTEATPPPPPPTASGKEPSAGKAAQPKKTRLFREGTFIVSRRGRVVHTPAGEWQFVFDNGTQNAPTHEPPLALMPCEKLMALEKVAEKHGEDATFTMSGQIFVYNGRNYLLPTNFVTNRQGSDVKPLQ